jgi:hypothetical protein
MKDIEHHTSCVQPRSALRKLLCTYWYSSSNKLWHQVVHDLCGKIREGAHFSEKVLRQIGSRNTYTAQYKNSPYFCATVGM